MVGAHLKVALSGYGDGPLDADDGPLAGVVDDQHRLEERDLLAHHGRRQPAQRHVHLVRPHRVRPAELHHLQSDQEGARGNYLYTDESHLLQFARRDSSRRVS